MTFSNDETPAAQAPTTEIRAGLKAWHKPVISRMEIAQTLCGGGPFNDADSAPNS